LFQPGATPLEQSEHKNSFDLQMFLRLKLLYRTKPEKSSGGIKSCKPFISDLLQIHMPEKMSEHDYNDYVIVRIM
jgi:hypothetical protein